ncbi:hypothetical protein P3S67_025884 [Capsicum chacoense]
MFITARSPVWVVIVYPKDVIADASGEKLDDISELPSDDLKDDHFNPENQDSGKEFLSFHGHKNTVLCVNWNQNGNWILSSAKDQIIKLYDISAMKNLESYHGHQNDVTLLACIRLEAPSTPGAFAFGILQTEGTIPGVGTVVPLSIPSLDSSPQGEQKTSMPMSMPLGDPPLPYGPHPSLLASNQQQPYQQNMQQVQQQQSLPQQMTSLPLQPSNLPQLEDMFTKPLQISKSEEDVGPLSPLAVSLTAGLSGSLAAAASHGFDTAKSRSQCMVLPKNVLCIPREDFSNGNFLGRDLRVGPGSILQIGISYFMAWDCGWHGVELHPLWL